MSRPDAPTRDFWSRRREAVAAEADAEVLADERQELAVQEAEKTDEELLEELGLPDPDTLGLGDDFSAFMGKLVPDRLRRRALRVLWRTNPTLANLDAMVDYGEDFTDKAMCVENMQTAYQVGKGMLTHVLKMEEEAKALDDATAEDTTDEDNPDNTDPEEIDADVVLADAELDENVPAIEAETETKVAQTSVPPHATLIPEPDAPALPPRRMQFAFDDDVGATA